MTDRPTAFRDLPADNYPFTVEAFDLEGRVVWTERVEGPGSLYIPPLAQTYGPVGVRIITPMGTTETPPPE